ncbi:MAG: 30S ribosomal protein S9 [Dehalococcoidia bacterium]
MANKQYFPGTGRRKTSVAQVRLFPGGGAIIVNGKSLSEFSPRQALQEMILEPLKVTETGDKFNATIKVAGGGISGQTGAIRHGIARALLKADESLRPLLRKHGLLTRDARAKERKKYGLKRARKAPQYTKR